MSFIDGTSIYVLVFAAVIVIAVPIIIEVAYNWLKMKRGNRYARKWLAGHPDADWIDFIKHSRGEK